MTPAKPPFTAEAFGVPFPIDLDRIRALERALGRNLPASYVAHMQKTNGGNTPDDRWLLHPIADTSDHTRIKRTARHVLRETEQARQHPGFPKDALVIGEDMENTPLLRCSHPDAPDRFDPAVYAWHPFHQELVKVAEDFAGF